jgi:post-segregation antitoxin (ccd killing protein)
MPRPRHYVPAIGRFLVKVIHHEAKSRGVPMTRVVDRLLGDALRGTEAWRTAEAETAAELAGPRDNRGCAAAPASGGGRPFRYDIPGEEETADRKAA